MTNTPTHVPCPTCGGCGSVPLKQARPELGRLCERLYGTRPLSVQDLHAAKPRPTLVTLRDRLETLRRLGFVTREKCGRRWVYSLTEAGRAVARQ